MTATFFFSLRSPYSWLAYRRLCERHDDVLHRLRWVPTWEPDELTEKLLADRGGVLPFAPMSRAKNLYILQDITRLTRESGRRMTWPLDRDPVWEIPHLAYLRARHQGAGAEFIAAAYQARWEQGRDICDRAIVAELGESLGLDPDELASAVDDPALREEGADSLLEVCENGAFGVPFFVCGDSTFWGAERVDAFAALLRDPGQDVPVCTDGPSTVEESLDYSHAGGCG